MSAARGGEIAPYDELSEDDVIALQRAQDECERWHVTPVTYEETGILRDRVEELTAERDWLRSMLAAVLTGPSGGES